MDPSGDLPAGAPEPEHLPAAPPRRRRLRATVQVASGLLALGLTAALVAQLGTDGNQDATARAGLHGAHAGHGTATAEAAVDQVPVATSGTDQGAHAADHGSAMPGASGTSGTSATAAKATMPPGHDHGDLHVTVMIGPTSVDVAPSVRPGAWVTVVNHSGRPQTLTSTDDGDLDVDVPLMRLVTFRAPTGAGDYAFASSQDEGLAGVLHVR